MEVFGYYHKMKARCDYCHIPQDKVYVVRDGPCTGTFCGPQHYRLAKEAMDNKKAPKHENTQS